MVLRTDREQDFRRLYDLFVQYEEDLPPDLRHGTVPSYEQLRITYRQPNAAAFLAVQSTDAVGCVAVRGLDVDTAIMLRLFVTPTSRKLGAARSLVNATIDFAREQGYRRIALDTSKERLAAAYSLYRSLGFNECPPFGHVAYACPTFMELSLHGE